MLVMFEVYYRPPADRQKEADLTARLSNFGGRLSYREDGQNGNTGICLTFEFDDRAKAEAAAQLVREQGEHVEGPVDYET